MMEPSEHMNMRNSNKISYSQIIVYLCALVLFLIPFFWFEPGYINLGGDGGRLYFLDPLAVAKSALNYTNSAYGYSFSFIPYLYFLYSMLQVLRTPTNLIAFEHGLNLSLSFLYIVLILRVFLSNHKYKNRVIINDSIGITAGVAYISLITKTGWPVALPTLNQIFLNVMIFYHMLQYIRTSKFRHLISICLVTLVFSINFGLGNAPQLLSFYPLSLIFIYIYTRYIENIPFQWKNIFILILTLVGIHSFHIFPILMSLFNSSSIVHSQVFSESVIKNAGLFYFTENHAASGKISRELFQWWLSKDILIYILPITIVGGFLSGKSKLLLLLGSMFLGTLFLVSANITEIGVKLYTLFFYIPGFSMFRSFNEKWFYVFAFYYVLLFGMSLYYMLRRRHICSVISVSFILTSLFIYRLLPFFKGDVVHSTLYMSNGVSSVFTVDPDLVDSLLYVKKLPKDGKVLTLPLTFPYFQISYGQKGGAYEGISMVSNIANRQDFAGLWSFGPYEKPMIEAILSKDFNQIRQILSMLNVRYIYRNSDDRVMDRFPKYPYVPIKTFESKDDIPAIKNQRAYDDFLSGLHAKLIYQKGFYSIYELDQHIVRPLIYIPDYIKSTADYSDTNSFSWAFLDTRDCRKISCDATISGIPNISYTKKSETLYEITLDISKQKKPFLLVFTQPYVSDVQLSLDEKTIQNTSDHILVNNYANGWVIYPEKYSSNKRLKGFIYLRSIRNAYIGSIVSLIFVFLVLAAFVFSYKYKKL